MPRLIKQPAVVQAAGNKPKQIQEFFGRINTQDQGISIAKMTSPPGWIEPGQRPQFHEYTIVLKGAIRVEFENGCLDVEAGQGVVAEPGEWVRYSTPGESGAEYIAICLPAFSPENVHRDHG